MPISNFPFRAIAPGHPLRPILPIKIFNPETGKSLSVWGLIDTGADDCALPASYAKILGHNLLEGDVKKIHTGNGETQAYAHTTRMEIFSIDGRKSIYTIEDTPIDFMPNLNSVLLGVKSFLGKFKLTIDYPNHIFSLNLPEK